MPGEKPTHAGGPLDQKGARYVPTNLIDAVQAAYQGQLVDVSSGATPLVPPRDGICLQQNVLDTITAITGSEDFSDFRTRTREALQGVTGQTIFVDIERTVIETRSYRGSNDNTLLYANPYLAVVIEELAANGFVGVLASFAKASEG